MSDLSNTPTTFVAPNRGVVGLTAFLMNQPVWVLAAAADTNNIEWPGGTVYRKFSTGRSGGQDNNHNMVTVNELTATQWGIVCGLTNEVYAVAMEVAELMRHDEETPVPN